MFDLREVTEFLKDASKYIIGLALLIIIFFVVLSFQPIAGNSMTTTLEDGDIVIVNRLLYKASSVKRNQIVVVKTDGKLYVKRVIGLPRENISYMDNILYINGTSYKEPFLDDNIVTNNFLFEDICSKEECPDNVIPEDMYLVLGDYRNNSEDSRTFGLIKRSEIIGQVVFRIWPINKIGRIK